jgi:hypothetical protein
LGIIKAIIEAFIRTFNDILRVTKDHFDLARDKVRQDENKRRERGTAADISNRLRNKATRNGDGKGSDVS